MNLKNKIFIEYIKYTILKSPISDNLICGDIENILNNSNIAYCDMKKEFPKGIKLVMHEKTVLMDVFPIYKKDIVMYTSNGDIIFWDYRASFVSSCNVILSKKDFRNYKLTKLLNNK